ENKISLVVLVLAIGSGIFMTTLDTSVIVLLLETIKDDFNIQQNHIQWVILVYLMVMMAFTVLSGNLGDKYGYKLLFQIGVGILILGCILCFFSHSFAFLIVSRVIVSIGVSSIISNGMAILTYFTTTENRGSIIGFTNLLIGLSVLIGVVLASVLKDKFGWNSAFLINIPIGIASLISVKLCIPKITIESKKQGTDWMGAFAFALFLSLLILSFSVFVDLKINRYLLWAGIILLLSFVFLGAFILIETRTKNPFIDLEVIKNKKILVGIITAILAELGMIVIVYQYPFYLQEIQGMTNIMLVGLTIAGLPIAMPIFAVIAGKISDKIDARIISTIGLVCMSLTFLVLIFIIKIDTPIWQLVIVSVLMGASSGIFMTPNNNSVMTAAPKEKLGVVGALSRLSMSVGISLGTALSACLFVLSGNILERRTGLGIEHPPHYIISLRVEFIIFSIIVLLTAFYSYSRGPEERGKKLLKGS
ncbi:MAG: MFS transporter, partial [Candidatus Heimdallarchaeota archaeon]|nr:MFS transporter [Candidatus Heimdallarchaeota archaeon]MCK4878691.1 MFS transporter [Candidatus Heimdallarchaeota archaeon]